MERRTFIKKTIQVALASNLLFSSKLFAGFSGNPDLVIANGKQPADLLKLSLNAIGGLEQFDIKGKRVIIKPTIQWDSAPEESRNTNPELIYSIIRQCYDAKAWEVYVFDHTTDDWRLSYQTSGIEKATKLAFGKIIPANDYRYYEKHNDTQDLFCFHQLVHKCDLIINVPKLRIETPNMLWGAVQNLQGLTWENGHFSPVTRDCDMLSILNYIQPVLNVAEVSIVNAGEKQQEVALLTGKNSITIDAFACQLAGIDPYSIGYLKCAAEMGIGSLKTDHLTIQKIFT